MRTVRRLGTVMVISVLGAGIAASCALPAYHAGESSSGSGSGGKGAASSSGQGGDTSVASSSSSKSSSDASSSSGGTDGGSCSDWITCDTAATKGKLCDCFGQKCTDPQCGNNGFILVCDAAAKAWKAYIGPSLTCCPKSPPCDPAANKLCLAIPDPNTPGTKKGQCVDNPCGAQMLPLDCTCAHSLCQAPQPCSTPAPNTVFCGP
jgi:hypothetical protein